MKNNQPVTQQEYVIPDNVFIYSRTDPKGVITEVNAAFAEISGFTEAELLGQPHNMVRHPDMPVAAFADMWASLKQGVPWKGLVKNRRKNGDYYWVVANASPVRENGIIVGYQSVRLRPTRQQIDAAEQAYRRLNAGERAIRVHAGRIIKNRSAFMEKLLSCEARLQGFVLFAVVTELTGFVSDYGWWSLSKPLHQILSIILLLFSLYMLFYYLPFSLGRLRAIRDFLTHSLTGGDLSLQLEVKQNDLVGELAAQVDSELSSLRATIQIIADSAREVAESAQRLGHSVMQLMKSADQQSATSSAAAAGVEQMTVSIGEVAQHAESTQKVAESTGLLAKNGAHRSKQATATIQGLEQTVSDSAETVEQLGQRTEEVGKVAAVIKDIADQTNLLALNAAIEAARAGEQGRGFAVVADEVRKLAERTARATQEIDQMIARIQGDTSNAVNGMRKSAEQVEQSVNLVQEAEGSLNAINGEMLRTLEMVEQISLSSSEQSSAMQVMAQSVEQVANLTSDSLALASHTNDISLALLRSVDKMEKAVAQYRV